MLRARGEGWRIAARVVRLLLLDELRYAVAAARWEGWGAPGDPRNDRPELTREAWRARGGGWRV